MQHVVSLLSPPPVSLAQGIVHWAPPTGALDVLRDSLGVNEGDIFVVCLLVSNGFGRHFSTAANMTLSRDLPLNITK
jgi:hypothetical protein